MTNDQGMGEEDDTDMRSVGHANKPPKEKEEQDWLGEFGAPTCNLDDDECEACQ